MAERENDDKNVPRVVLFGRSLERVYPRQLSNRRIYQKLMERSQNQKNVVFLKAALPQDENTQRVPLISGKHQPLKHFTYRYWEHYSQCISIANSYFEAEDQLESLLKEESDMPHESPETHPELTVKYQSWTEAAWGAKRAERALTAFRTRLEEEGGKEVRELRDLLALCYQLLAECMHELTTYADYYENRLTVGAWDEWMPAEQ